MFQWSSLQSPPRRGGCRVLIQAMHGGEHDAQEVTARIDGEAPAGAGELFVAREVRLDWQVRVSFP
jgi:hypothetical protein